MPRVLLLIPSRSYRATDFLAAARRLGVEVAVASDRENPVAGTLRGRALTLDFGARADAVARIERFADAYPLDAIVAVDEAGTVLAAAASERLALPHNAPAAAEAARNKALMRERLSAAGVASPWYRRCRFAADVAAMARAAPFPCVVKPLALSGSRGVMRADDEAQFIGAVRRLERLLGDPAIAAECGETAGEYLVEGYIPGDEVSLEGLLRSGALHTLAIFDKPEPLTGPFFEETIYVTPSRLDPDRQRAVADTVQRAAAALGLCDGPLHAEVRLNARGVWPVDIAARTIGGLCARTLTFGTGMSLEEIVLRHAIGAPLESLERESAAAGVMMIPIPAAGTLRGVTGVEAARAAPGITEVTITIPIGRPVTPLPEGGDYLGFILARGEGPDGVEASLRASHACLWFDISADSRADSGAVSGADSGADSGAGPMASPAPAREVSAL